MLGDLAAAIVLGLLVAACLALAAYVIAWAAIQIDTARQRWRRRARGRAYARRVHRGS